MASPTQWTWAWVNSGSWWGTGRPGMLQSMGSQRVGHDWATELNWRRVLGETSLPRSFSDWWSYFLVLALLPLCLYLFIQVPGDSLSFFPLFRSFTKYLFLRVLPKLTSVFSASFFLAVHCSPTHKYLLNTYYVLLSIYLRLQLCSGGNYKREAGKEKTIRKPIDSQQDADLVLFTTSEVHMHLRSDERGGGGGHGGDGEKRETFQSPS